MREWVIDWGFVPMMIAGVIWLRHISKQEVSEIDTAAAQMRERCAKLCQYITVEELQGTRQPEHVLADMIRALPLREPDDG